MGCCGSSVCHCLVVLLCDEADIVPDGEPVILAEDVVLCLFSIKGADEWRICFDVYQPDTVADFKKSNPGKPYSRMCVCR